MDRIEREGGTVTWVFLSLINLHWPHLQFIIMALILLLRTKLQPENLKGCFWLNIFSYFNVYRRLSALLFRRNDLLKPIKVNMKELNVSRHEKHNCFLKVLSSYWNLHGITVLPDGNYKIR